MPLKRGRSGNMWTYRLAGHDRVKTTHTGARQSRYRVLVVSAEFRKDLPLVHTLDDGVDDPLLL